MPGHIKSQLLLISLLLVVSIADGKVIKIRRVVQDKPMAAAQVPETASAKQNNWDPSNFNFTAHMLTMDQVKDIVSSIQEKAKEMSKTLMGQVGQVGQVGGAPAPSQIASASSSAQDKLVSEIMQAASAQDGWDSEASKADDTEPHYTPEQITQLESRLKEYFEREFGDGGKEKRLARNTVSAQLSDIIEAPAEQGKPGKEIQSPRFINLADVKNKVSGLQAKYMGGTESPKAGGKTVALASEVREPEKSEVVQAPAQNADGETSSFTKEKAAAENGETLVGNYDALENAPAEAAAGEKKDAAAGPTIAEIQEKVTQVVTPLLEGVKTLFNKLLEQMPTPAPATAKPGSRRKRRAVEMEGEALSAYSDTLPCPSLAEFVSSVTSSQAENQVDPTAEGGLFRPENMDANAAAAVMDSIANCAKKLLGEMGTLAKKRNVAAQEGLETMATLE